MIITTVINKIYTLYERYFKQPMQMFEMNLNKIISKNPHLINALDRSTNRPSSRKKLNFHLLSNKCMC